MRLRYAFAVVVVAGVALLPGAAAASAVRRASVADGPLAYAAAPCGSPRLHRFPLAAAVGGGPGAYAPGGRSGEFEVRLRNTAGTACRRVHPVVVLTDTERALRPRHIRLRFYDAGAARWRTVRFRKTDRDEVAGVFGGSFPGFTVRPGDALTVRLRLRFTADAPLGDGVTATVTAMRKRGADGDWLGQSRGYRFALGRHAVPGRGPGHPGGSGTARPGGSGTARPGESRTTRPDESRTPYPGERGTARPDESRTPHPGGSGTVRPDESRTTRPDESGTAGPDESGASRPGGGSGEPRRETPSRPGNPEGTGPEPPALADTGQAPGAALPWLAGTAAAFMLTGRALVIAARRRR